MRGGNKRPPEHFDLLAGLSYWAAIAALRELEARLRQPDPEEQVEMPLDARMLKGLSVVTLTTRNGPFDVLFALSGAPPYEELRRRAAEVAPFHLTVRVASIENLTVRSEWLSLSP